MNKYRSAIFLIAEVLMLILLALSMVYVRGCVNASTKNTHSSECTTEGAVTQATCPKGQTGRIFQICKSGKLVQSFNDCKAATCSKTTFSNLAPIITAKCVSCHTGFDTIAVAKTKIDEMIRRVNLGDSDPARMPKAPNKPLEAAEKQVFKDWKAQGELDTCPDDAANPTMNLNQMEDAMLADINSLSQGNQEETRWLVVTHKSNEGSARPELNKYVAAINKGLNSISTGRNILLSVPIDKAATIYRFNLNDIKLTFAAWNLIEQNDPINFESNTNIGDLLKTLTNSKKPWMTVDAFLASAMKANVYYALQKIPSDFKSFLVLLGVNQDVQLANFQALQVGFANSPISLNKNRLLVRFDSNNGALWSTFDTDGNARAEQNLFQFPLLNSFSGKANFSFAASEEIFGLINGLHGYALFDAAGKRLDAAALNIVAHNVHPPADPTIKAASSCFRCHNNGLIVKKDELRASADLNADQFNLQDLDQIDQLYRNPAAPFANDNAEYALALSKIGVSVNDQDPISLSLDNLTERTLDANAVASYLFITKQQFLDGLNRSADGKAQIGTLLSGGTITPQQFFGSLPIIYRDLRPNDDPLNP